jgi:hypothetical protein
MKQFLVRHRKNLIFQAVYSGAVLSLFVYAVLRFLFYDFPMPVLEEIAFFLKTFLASSFLIATATGGSAWLYLGIKKMQRTHH